MNNFKPSIFIGSSTEGLPVVKQVQKELSSVAECKIWTQQFELGISAYEDLVEKLSLYDYGLLVATSDDKTLSRKVNKASPRDNVIFEFGLFAGRLGRLRSFLMAESCIKLPSDMSGITLPFFPPAKSKEHKQKITECCNAIKAHITRQQKIFDFGFLPSTSLAYGYYKNFILKAVTTLLDTKTVTFGNTCNFPKQCQKEAMAAGSPAPPALDNLSFTELEFSILIPNALSADMFDHVKNQRRQSNWKLIKIDAGAFRPFDFYVQSIGSDGILKLSDVPLTLNALGESIKAYVAKAYVGVSESERTLEIRELRTFKGVLDCLIQENPLTKTRVKTELV